MKSFEMFLRLVHEFKELRKAKVGIFDEENPEWTINHVWYEDGENEDDYLFSTEFDKNEGQDWKEVTYLHGNAANQRDVDKLNRYLFGLLGIGHYIFLNEDRDFYISNFYLDETKNRIYFSAVNIKEVQ